MKAAICTQYGEPSVLKLQEVVRPSPKDDEVLVKIHSTAVTASDCYLRRLDVPGNHAFPLKQVLKFAMRLFIGFNKPRNPILGLVFSGEIVMKGKDVETLNVGNEVFGFTGVSRGAYAEYKCVSKKEIERGEICLKPENTSHNKVASLVYGGVLATHFMRNFTIGKGQKVLIYGASGAIGTIAIQLAKQQGAEVTAVCSSENLGLVTFLGADKTIDYTEKDAVNQLELYDFILDAVGKNKTSNLKQACKEFLLPKGKYVSVDDGLLKVQPSYLDNLKKQMEEKTLQPVIDKLYSLDEIVEAHTYVEKGHKKGNVIIKVT
ncbi:MAG: NAD(P)-dependent alcohol dehydrogenase [Winogradskyella sp.]